MLNDETCTYSGDVCVLTNVFINFLGDDSLFPAVSECDPLFGDDAEKKLFCQAIKQTVVDFAATGINWNDANYQFPFICNGRSATVCDICRAVQAEYAASGGNPNYERLTNTVIDDIIQPQEACLSSIRGGRRDRFGEIACSYALQINSEFTCAAWTGLLANPSCANLTAEECFNQLLTSNLIEGAAIRLYNSSYCQKEMDTYPVTNARLLAHVVV